MMKATYFADRTWCEQGAWHERHGALVKDARRLGLVTHGVRELETRERAVVTIALDDQERICMVSKRT